MKSDNTPYKIVDLKNNKRQQEVLCLVLAKLKEWIEFPEKKKEHPDIVFDPLHLTVIGSGGTGKSFVIHLLCNVMEKLFKDIDTMVLGAPTGSASFNIFGSTIHSQFNLRPKMKNYRDFIRNKETLIKRFKRKLIMILDERSLISQEIMGLIDETLHHTLHGGTKQQRRPFGGLPIVIAFGDDHQLPSIVINGSGKGAIYHFDKNRKKNMNQRKKQNNPKFVIENNGMGRFLDLASNVIELNKNYRKRRGEKKLSKMLKNLRDGDGLDREEVQILERLHINNLSATQLEELKKEATFIFARKNDCYQYNFDRLSKMVTKDNPLASIQSDYSGTKKSHFTREEQQTKALLCRNAKVAIKGQNFMPKWGLFNGAVGTVIHINFEKGDNPNNKDRPTFVIVDFKNYKGPIWNKKHPTVSA